MDFSIHVADEGVEMLVAETEAALDWLEDNADVEEMSSGALIENGLVERAREAGFSVGQPQ